MVFLSAVTVHTSGINWESLSVIVGSLGVLIIGLATYIDQRLQRSRKETERQIIAEVSKVTIPLSATLESVADRLGKVDEHLASQDERIIAQGEKIAHVQGQLSAPRDTIVP